MLDVRYDTIPPRHQPPCSPSAPVLVGEFVSTVRSRWPEPATTRSVRECTAPNSPLPRRATSSPLKRTPPLATNSGAGDRRAARYSCRRSQRDPPTAAQPRPIPSRDRGRGHAPAAGDRVDAVILGGGPSDSLSPPSQSRRRADQPNARICGYGVRRLALTLLPRRTRCAVAVQHDPLQPSRDYWRTAGGSIERVPHDGPLSLRGLTVSPRRPVASPRDLWRWSAGPRTRANASAPSFHAYLPQSSRREHPSRQSCVSFRAHGGKARSSASAEAIDLRPAPDARPSRLRAGGGRGERAYRFVKIGA